jgi:hypothetical protein
MLERHRRRGSAAEAAGWVHDSQLTARDRAAMLRFVARFPGRELFRDEAALFAAVASRDGVAVPPPLLAARRTLGFVAGGALARFDDFDRIVPRTDSLDRLRYDLEWRGYGGEERRELLLTQAGFYPIATTTQPGRSTLAVNLRDPLDPQIYELAEEDLLDAVAEGGLPRESAYAAFHSYATLLSHVVELEG